MMDNVGWHGGWATFDRVRAGLGLAHQSVQEMRNEVSTLDELLFHARNDFTAADLRRANLDRVDLDGVRWSKLTQWPEAWSNRVRVVSEQIAPGLYVIRSATAHATASTADTPLTT